jgi:hypothetical protein
MSNTNEKNEFILEKDKDNEIELEKDNNYTKESPSNKDILIPINEKKSKEILNLKGKDFK